MSVTGIAVSHPNSRHLNDASKSKISSGALPLIYIYSCSKDHRLIKWNFWTGRVEHVFDGARKPTKRFTKKVGGKIIEKPGTHSDHILSVDVSSDGQYVVGISILTYILSSTIKINRA